MKLPLDDCSHQWVVVKMVLLMLLMLFPGGTVRPPLEAAGDEGGAGAAIVLVLVQVQVLCVPVQYKA